MIVTSDSIFPQTVLRSREERHCTECGAAFIALILRTRVTCSSRCKTQWYRKQNPERYRDRRRETDRKSRERNLNSTRKRHLVAVQRWRETNREAERERARLRRQDPAYKERLSKIYRAHSSLQNAMRKGEIVRPEACEWCGMKGKPIEAAHSDYSKPLNVQWLCRPCHRRDDAATPKTLKDCDRLRSAQKRVVIGLNPPPILVPEPSPGYARTIEEADRS